MPKKLLVLSRVVPVLVGLGFLSGCIPDPKPLTLPAPTGPFTVSTFAIEVTDPQRPDDRTADEGDFRPVKARIWYPSEVDVTEPTAYAPAVLSAAAAASYHMDPGFAEFIVTQNQANLRIADAGAPYPLVLFSHGLGTSPEAHTTTLQDLASRGYFVVSVNHTYGSAASVFDDGTVAEFNVPARPADPGPFASQSERDAYQEALDAWHDNLIEEWRADLELVLNFLLDSKKKGLVLFDSDKIAAAGHSFGGAAALAFALGDERVDCVADLDGTLWAGLQDQAFDRPFLLANTPTLYTRDASRAAVFDQLTGPGFRIDVRGAGHLNFSDVGLLTETYSSPLWRHSQSPLDIGRGDSVRLLRVTNAYLAGFLDEYLKDTPSPLLDGPSSDYPEVTLTSR
ncbi:MAG: hypothetical protein GC168_18125 [Candidatus Hydrogenedens sp.]|nr:hypothetical protein [Candidatus Hydrogenedens sp.]